jgi:hypothetical protein
MTSAIRPLGTDMDAIESLIVRRYGLSVTRWMLDIVTSIRGRSGTLPIAAEGLASSLGIKLVEELSPARFGSTEMLDGNEFKISVAISLDADDRNFTIAHELGHIFFLKATDGQLTSGPAVERLCDLFGAYLLAPIQLVHRHLRTHGATISSIEGLAESLSLPQRALWKLIAEHYPVSFWWIRENTFDWVGRFDLKPIEDNIRNLRGGELRSKRSRVVRPMTGISEWSIEGCFDGGSTYGIVKPVGRHVRQSPLVKSINVPREHLLKSQTGEWRYSDPDRITAKWKEVE